MLREISLFYSMIHTVVLFILLFESRLSRKKTIALTLATMIPLVAVNTALIFFLDADTMGTAMLLTLSLPSLIVFFVLSKHRDGRFFFTFCLVDTVALEIIYLTNILNFYITPDKYVFMLAVRLVAYPLLEWFVYKKLRSGYLEIQRQFKRGWWIFTAISAIFYILMTLMMNFPTSITERPEYIPAMILVFVLVPVIYIHIFLTFARLKRLYDLSEQEEILRLQAINIGERIRELTEANEKFREERHNFRHKLKVIASLLHTEQYEELELLVSEYREDIQKTQVKRYCKSPVIDAVLSAYIKRAESRGIKVELKLAFPDDIPVNETELATVFANAIENAINACEKLPESERQIEIKVICEPKFMAMIKNTFNGEVEFDDKGVPVNRRDGHGFGTRSIVAFCTKYGSFYQFVAKDNTFALYLNF